MKRSVKKHSGKDFKVVRGIGVFEDVGARRIRGLEPEIIQANVDENLLKKVAKQVAKEIGKNIKLDPNIISSNIQKEGVKIKTDYDFPIEDETKGLKSNIDKIGAKQERQKSDIDKSVGLFKNIKKKGVR
ncbi:MAG: hypothetical protein ISS82_04600 [Nanoarchaeota archaeon]|nr:hypothetical protein [Nanoarchaeota archaeon]